MTDAPTRAEVRRTTWAGGVARSFEHMEEIDLDFWLAMTPEDRLRAMWSLVDDSLALEGTDGSLSRLQKSIGGVRSLRDE